MSKIVKNIIAVSISTIVSLVTINTVYAATYKVVERGDVSNLKRTYTQSQNLNGEVAISGTDNYNIPVQFEYLTETDFDAIEIFSIFNHETVHGLEVIEDSDALRAGNPTGNDLAWVIRWLQDTGSQSYSGTGLNLFYQKIGDSVAQFHSNGVTLDYKLWDVTFEGTNELTRSTVDILSGITNSGISYGTGTAPYLPLNVPSTESYDFDLTYWMREFGQRGFYSFNNGQDVFQLIPEVSEYGGGISSILDVNESGVAVGYNSYDISDTFVDYIENGAPFFIDHDNDDSTPEVERDLIRFTNVISSFFEIDLNNPDDGIDDELTVDYVINGCNDPYILKHIPFDVCVYYVNLYLGNPYRVMAFKTILTPNGTPTLEQLGLLVNPHPDDTRNYSSYALAVNNNGVAVGYADGFLDETVTEPDVDEFVFFQYAVAYKNGEVIDLTGDHTNKGGSKEFDINDSGIAVGHITLETGVNKFFYVDTTVPKEELNLINPDDYFRGSDSTARAINNHGLIVGEGEIETHNETSLNVRRTAAFVYDINNDLFINLNDTIPCTAQATYNIFEARDINDDGIISATAIIQEQRRDAKGELMFNDNGAPLTEDVVRAISLEPIEETNENCGALEEESKVKRKGASIGFSGFFTIMAIIAIRRKFIS